MKSFDGGMTGSNVGKIWNLEQIVHQQLLSVPFKTSNKTSNVPKESQSNFKHMNVSENLTLDLGKPEGWNPTFSFQCDTNGKNVVKDNGIQ